MNVLLEVPNSVAYQLVYRMARNQETVVTSRVPDQFVYVESLGCGLRWIGALRSRFGCLGVAKALAKVVTRSRALYFVVQGQTVVSYGWSRVGHCRYYQIEPDAVVIGPIWTSPDVRGRGLATAALQAAIDEGVRRGRRLFYIDTSNDNVSAQRVFEKCGFGMPVAAYLRVTR